ncbi:hypothetical protein MAR_024455 [Mya arenaria]|uniref:Uncharacterized protein n=1 Tax=Mya arenaria TaxID=6604 RepID=A0ABY7DTU7_MYAAR|nr:hypothetical protein MAR_024455 [Mya arenaria]
MGYYERDERPRYPRSVIWIIAAVLLFIALVLHVVGVATDYWVNVLGIHSGLWRTCALGTCAYAGTDVTTDWLKGTQAVEIIGLLLGFIALLAISVILCFPKLYRWRAIALVSALLAGVLIIVGVIIYGAKVEDNLDYSFGLCCCAGDRSRTEYYSSDYPRELRAPAYDDRRYPRREYTEDNPYRYERRNEHDRYESPLYERNAYDGPYRGYDRPYGKTYKEYDPIDRPYGRTYRDNEPNYYSKTRRYDYY